MKYEEIHPSLRQALGNYEGFRRLGFKSDDLSLEIANGVETEKNELAIYMVLKTQDKVFRMFCGPWPRAIQSQISLEWRLICDQLRTGEISEQTLDRIYADSLPYQKPDEFRERVSKKGFTLPILAPN